MEAYQRRFGECDATGACFISTTRQSAITGLLSTGATIGAVSSGAIADRVSLIQTQPKRTLKLTLSARSQEDLYPFHRHLPDRCRYRGESTLRSISVDRLSDMTDIIPKHLRSNPRRSTPNRSRSRSHLRSCSCHPGRTMSSTMARSRHRFFPVGRHHGHLGSLNVLLANANEDR